ncbi:Thiol:disulfide interchange protein DsbE [Marinomonas spartinae]|uniref:Thiol:disulfide interchange protein DsbE n=1 Tax=Marinomonas spartinae TaxID=1792290 RepID=A0A1A8TH37_9GAMM|nr:DsbE family thiol:disulfide interchange protein [Marinomonas spartinae]SBS32833.1 Thiol:disulfide interchange protein DsbE [Marinomonas spartinae]
MRKVIFFIPLVVFIALGIVFYLQLGKNPEYMPSALVGKPVPAIHLVSLDTDQVVTNVELPKGPYLINFWGTWCPTCAIEHPYLMRLAKKGVPIIGIDYKDGKASAEQWLRNKGNPYKMVLLDELGNFGVNMGVTGAPETFVVNSKGIIVYRHQGALDEAVWKSIQGYMQ